MSQEFGVRKSRGDIALLVTGRSLHSIGSTSWNGHIVSGVLPLGPLSQAKTWQLLPCPIHE